MSGEKIDIMDRMDQLQSDGRALVDMLERLRQYHGIGIRYVDENDEPVSLGDNVVNLFEDKI